MKLRTLLSALILGTWVTTTPSRGEPIDFDRQVRPILARHCFLCHGPDESTRRAGLRLDVRDRAIAPARRDGPPAIVPGDSVASLLMRRVTSTDADDRMPPDDRPALTPEQVDVIRRWIDQDAPYTRHWSWRPPQRVPAPDVRDKAWPRDDIDRFILTRLQDAGLQPAPPADRATLLRRLTFDLTGLPPTPAEVDAFVSDDDPDAYERVVDRLLDSPHFGERWARHWLDLVRYAETYGHEFDYPIRHAWQYRDYVIRAFNADVPYDRLVTEHIAGDLLDDPRRHPEAGYNESIIGTGFWFLSQGTHGPVDVRGDEAERVANQIDVMSKTVLGLTVSCARCHDHKFDAITTKDYYALAGFLQSSRRQEAYLDPHGTIAGLVSEIARLRADQSRRFAAALPSPAETDIAPALLAAHEALYGEPRPGDPPVPAIDVFSDFEDGTYEAWEIEGTAFGATPVTQQTIGPWQGDVEAHGLGFVNSHLVRNGEDSRGADAHTGAMTSRLFTITRPWIRFQIGGGAHPGRTGVHVLVDGAVVRAATGHDSNRMRTEVFDVRELVGREARFEIIDRVEGGWGHIGVDYIVFADTRRGPASRRPVDVVSREHDMEPQTLSAWIAALSSPALDDVDHPLHVWRLRVGGEDEPEDDHDEAGNDEGVVFTDFAGDDYHGWHVTGHAFGERPSGLRAFTETADGPRLVPAGVAHSGLVANRLQGTLRSETFTIEREFIHYRMAGRGGRTRLIIDGYVLDEFNALLFEGFTIDVNTPEGAFARFRQDVGRYKGHRAHIEIIDDGGGAIAVDSIRFSDAARDHATAPEPFDSIEAAAAHERGPAAFALGRWRDGHATIRDTSLVNWLLGEGLLRLRAAETSAPQGLRALVDSIPAPMRALAIADGTPEDEHVFLRGDHRTPGDVVPRRFLESLDAAPAPPDLDGSGRLRLADRMLAASNPLTARVAVNRVWQYLYGRGLVATPDDFGALGAVPTHPDLLDALAQWFRTDAGWSMKKLIRRCVLTSTYGMSSNPDDEHAERVDPANTLLHRARVRRLSGEEIRDAILAVSGRLDPTMYGEPVPTHLTPFMTGRGRPSESGPLDGDGRRSVYLAVRRNFLAPMMLAFDAPIPSSTMGRRSVSNVPAQALFLMNDPFVVEQSRVWAERVTEHGGGDRARIDALYRSAFARGANEDEIDAALAFVAGTPENAWPDLCHALFNVKEFLFLR